MIPFSEFEKHCQDMRERVERACDASARRPESVRILPVTKGHPVEAILHAEKAGFKSVGESRVQEALGKQNCEHCPESIQWELIGHLQSNKSGEAAQCFSRIQSVDSEKLLRRLERHGSDLGRPMRILIQVNAGEDPAKYGVRCEEVEKLLEAALTCRHLSVEGLMTIAPLSENPGLARRCFARLRETRDQLRKSTGLSLDELSMGMTDDLEEAIAEGSTQVRLGRALYGERE